MAQSNSCRLVQANRLRQNHPEAAEQVYDLQCKLIEQWSRLTAKANNRKEKLLESYDYQRFLSDSRELMQWVTTMKKLVDSQELADDVTGKRLFGLKILRI
ncbi:unnamed protein product [Cylicostephanus goldi]|uniref:Uncharacterized protein n=1 Tax=Cylicostephanus goldi TaxID=71465 RepID=A0A3P6TSG2_CYLGO|nr:unnamed protein product [Cylicostephanus goldi]